MASNGKMTSMKRIMAVCNKEIPDRVPFLLTSREFGIKYAGLKYAQCYEDPNLYVNSQLRLLEEFELDGVWDIWCTPAVDEAMGAHMVVAEDDPPWIPEPYLNEREDISKLKPVDPRKDGRMPYMLEVVSRLKKAVGPDVPVIAWASPPFRTACMLRGSANLYLDIFDDPKFVKDLLDITYEACTAYGKALVDAGADIICTSNPVANMDCISRRHYEEFSHPYTKKMFGELKAHGAKAILYHTCGRWDDRFDLVCAENVDIIHCDKVDIKDFKEKYSDRIVVMGNVKSVVTLLQGTEEQVREETLACLQKGAPGGRYIISADCAVPRDTNPDNVRAMAAVVKQYRDYPLNF
ncbi:Uroporphyrinogen decarboxylase [Neomoorella glycerini]|uniref:Uroporphyrinogen decarboxylase n=1 Tax=Neomoorella glycerini TaxID=55779 RepID=A0A6I5ZPU2_9FIRM|nr:uroporphyrinogen decarboxylase family protein [Moorella glycerini]QGP91627.1 Uroporphyrinogen decarboxylase [Moorella glycerini]